MFSKLVSADEAFPHVLQPDLPDLVALDGTGLVKEGLELDAGRRRRGRGRDDRGSLEPELAPRFKVGATRLRQCRAAQQVLEVRRTAFVDGW